MLMPARASAEFVTDEQVFRGYIPELDSLRALGITLVVVGHFWPGGLNNGAKIVQLPWLFMDCFFVISGFLIASILLNTRTKPDYYKSFYLRRSLRILPVYYLVLIVVTVISFIWKGPDYTRMLNEWGSPLWFFVFLGNIPTALTGAWPFGAGGAYVPLWSIQIEEQFYLLFPLLVHRLRLDRLASILCGLVCLSVLLRIGIYYVAPDNKLAEYVLFPCRMDGLGLGALLAVRFRMGPWKISRKLLTVMTLAWLVGTLLFVGWSGFYHTRPLNRTLGFLFSSITSAHIVLWLIVFRESRLTSLFRLSPVQYIGKISYGIYLLHWPVGIALVAVSTALGTKVLTHGFVKPLAVFVLSIGCASLSWRYLEVPMLSLKNRLSPPAS